MARIDTALCRANTRADTNDTLPLITDVVAAVVHNSTADWSLITLPVPSAGDEVAAVPYHLWRICALDGAVQVKPVPEGTANTNAAITAVPGGWLRLMPGMVDHIGVTAAKTRLAVRDTF